MNYIEQIANMLGVEVNEEFKIKPTEKAKLLGCKEIDDTFRFDTELVRKGYDDGWSEWYGGCEKVLNYLLIGLYVIEKDSPSMSKNEELKNVAKPLVDYIRKNYHPHVSVIVDSMHAEILEGVAVAKYEWEE